MFTLTPTTIGKDLGAGMGVRRTKSRDLRKRKQRELGWNGYEMPISSFN